MANTANTAHFEEKCCAVKVSEGCIVGGGTWVTFRLADGSYETVNAATGDPVAQVDQLSECPREQYLTSINDMGPNASFTVPGDSDTLTGWSVRAIAGPVTLVLNSGTAIAVQPDETIESDAHADDSVLADVVAVTTGAGGAARVVYQNRQ